MTCAAQTVHLNGLAPGTLYSVTFRVAGAGVSPNGEDSDAGPQWTARFQTMPPEGAAPAGTGATLVTLSCDRFVDDGDDQFWAALAAPYLSEPLGVAVGMVHIGDQVYTDSLVARMVSGYNHTAHGPLGFGVGRVPASSLPCL